MDTEDGAITIRRAALPPPSLATPTALIAPLPQVNVVVTRDAACDDVRNRDNPATLTDTPAASIPMAIQSVAPDQLDSQQGKAVTDVLKNVSGTMAVQDIFGRGDISLRGFEVPVATDGLITDNANFTSSMSGLDIPPIGVEYVDVMKGADSILSGSSGPGGIVNVIRKMPQADPVYEVQAQLGSYREQAVGVDTAGALSADRKLSYRFVVQGERAGETYGGLIGSKTQYLALSLGYREGHTDIVIGYEQISKESPPPYYAPAVGGVPASVGHALVPLNDQALTNTSDIYYAFSEIVSSAWTINS